MKVDDLALSILNLMNSFVFIKECDSFTYLYINKATEKMFNNESPNIIGKNDFELFPTDIAEDFRAKDLKIIKNKETSITPFEIVYNHEQKKSFWVRTTKIPIIENGEVKYIIGIADDVSLYKTNEEDLEFKLDQLENQQRFLQDTINHLPGIFYSKDINGNFIYVNKAFNELINKTNDEIIGKNQFELFPKEIAISFRETDLNIINEKKTNELEEYSTDSNNEDHYFQSFKFPYIDKDNNVYATGGISLDITEKKKLEKINAINSKLASIGKMAASVGHEINNPLTIIQALIFKIQKRLQKESPTLSKLFDEDFSNAKNASIRITRIIQGLRTFSQQDISEYHDFDMVEVIEQTREILSPTFNKSEIQFTIKNLSEKKKVIAHGNKGNIQQAISNIILNAIDAVSTTKIKNITIEINQDDKFISISIRDSGIGISQEIHDRIFDAFFTTKDINKGTGIGLSIAQTVAKDHNGSILFTSLPNEGSTFHFKISNK